MEQAVPLQQYAAQFQQQQAAAQPQLISNMQPQPAGLGQSLAQQVPQQVLLQPAGFPVGIPAMTRPSAVPVPHGGVPVPVQPAAAVAAHSMPPFQLPIPGTLPRPPAALVQQRPAVPQIPPAMLPLLGYPLPLLQTMQNVSLEELAKHTGIPVALLQTQPQMQLAARQIMLQRIMAFQIQAQQAQQAAQRAPMAGQHSLQRAVPAKAKAVPKQPKQAKQPRTTPASRQAQAQPTSSEGADGGKDVGGKLIWAKLGTYPWWPAKTLSESDPSFPPDADPPRPTSIPIRFFGTYEFCWIGSKRAIADWDEAYDEHVRACDQDSFRAAVEEVEHFKKTGELPQVFYIRPPPEGRSKARGKRRQRLRSAHTPGAAGVGGTEDAYGTPGSAAAAPAMAARPRPQGKTSGQAAEERAAVVRARRKRLLQEMGLAAPDDSPYANGRICPNSALIALQQEFDEQWPPAERPPPPPTPAPALAAQQPPTGLEASTAMAPSSAGVGPAAGLAAALATGRSGMSAVPAAPAQLQQAALTAAQVAGLQQQQQQLTAPPVTAQQQQPQYAGHPVITQAAPVQANLQQQQLSLASLHQLTPQQQVALMAGLVQQAAAQQQAPPQ